jgi:lipopolysaccharide/colanic/teichoic acid biosynthesis glycosyltransferase
MILTKMLTRLLRAAQAPWRRRNPLSQLHGADTMRKILIRERVRTDRTSDPFSVITFTPRRQEQTETLWPRLVGLLGKRLRCTDEMGWLREHQLCVVLPHTTPAGAWTVADGVCIKLPEEILPPLCTVYSYPWKEADRNGWTAGEDVELLDPKTQPVLSLEPLFLKAHPLWKRALDIVCASLGLIFLLPVFAVIILAIKLTSRGPALFCQRRSGRGGKPFTLYKFRTMTADAETRKKALLALNEQDGPAFKLRNDPRVTRLGRFLRKSSLDELPQLWNVLRGDMTLVGPRPLPCEETAACEDWHRRRLDVLPGLTCIWQVRGRGTVAFADWIRMDLEYIRSRSLLQDVKLLVLTVPAVLLRRGAN